MRIFSLSILFGLLVFATSAQTQSSDQSTISVLGNASIAVKPTTTTINLGIESNSYTYPDAVKEMIERVEQLTKDLKKLGFEDKDLITSNFSVEPSRVYIRNMWKDTGFVARQNIMVSFPQDKKKLLEVLNTSTKSSANPSINLSFGLDAEKKETLRNELVKLAVKDAKEKAEIIALASGYKIIGVKTIEYGTVNKGPNPMYEARAMNSLMKSADVEMSNFEVSELTYNESISIVYLIDNK